MAHIKSMNSLSVHPLVDGTIGSIFTMSSHLYKSIMGF